MQVFDLTKVRHGLTNTDMGVGFSGSGSSLNLTTDTCRWGYQPTWSDDKPADILPDKPVDSPVVVDTPVIKETAMQNISELTVPPKKQDDLFLKAVLVGVGVFIFLKIIE